MLRLKQKKAEAAAALLAAQSAPTSMNIETTTTTTTETTTSETTTTTTETSNGTIGTANEKVSLMGGIGGKKVTTSDSGKKKRTPGEIRIQKDIAELDSGTVATVSFPTSLLTNFNVHVTPDSGYWSNCSYNFSFQIPALYPHEPPKVTCLTKIYHPNVNMQGNVCLNILREDWKPVLDINAVIYGLIYLFYEPNPDDPLNLKAAKVLREDKKAFERIVERSLKGGWVEGEEFVKLK